MKVTYQEKLVWAIEQPSGQLRVSPAFETWIGADVNHLDAFCARLEPLSASRLRVWIDENVEDPESGEIPLAFKDMQPSLYVCELVPVFDQGRPVSLQGLLTPILTMLQDQPIAETHRLQTLSEHGSLGIVITDPLDRIRECNPAFCLMLGQSQPELLGQKIIDHIHPADRQRQLRLYDQMRYGDSETVHVEKRYLRADGSYFWAEVGITLIRNPAGEISHFVRFIVELSGREQEDGLSQSPETA